MKLIYTFIILLLMGCCGPEAKEEKKVNLLIGNVIGITDGDTITVKDSEGEEHRIRLGEIDAPERSQEFGPESKQILNEMVFGKEVEVFWLKKDRFDWKTSDHKTKNGRIIGGVFLNQESVNRQLIERGAAWHYKEFSKDETFAQAEKYARENKYGLWQKSNPIPPWEYRKKK